MQIYINFFHCFYSKSLYSSFHFFLGSRDTKLYLIIIVFTFGSQIRTYELTADTTLKFTINIKICIKLVLFGKEERQKLQSLVRNDELIQCVVYIIQEKEEKIKQGGGGGKIIGFGTRKRRKRILRILLHLTYYLPSTPIHIPVPVVPCS